MLDGAGLRFGRVAGQGATVVTAVHGVQLSSNVRMTVLGEILLHRTSIEFAPGDAEPVGKLIGRREEVIRDGNGSFHGYGIGVEIGEGER